MRGRWQQLKGTSRLSPRHAAREACDAGFTLVELLVTMVVLTVVFGITMGLIIGLQQQQVNLSATVAGANQSQLASQEVVQYLRAASTPAAGSVETPMSFSLPAYIGAGAGLSPESVTITGTYATGRAGLPTGTGTLDITFTGQPVSGPVLTRTVATYFVLGPSAGTPIFTYYEYAPTGTPGTLQVMPIPTGPPQQMASACLGEIVAVGIDASFFAGPEDTPTRGYAADTATTIQTVVYLRNSSLVYGSTTTVPSVTTTAPAAGC